MPSPTISATGSFSSLLTVWQELAQQFPEQVALKDPHQKPALELTFQEAYTQITWFAGGLQALGVEAGDRVAIIADNSPRWLIADLGSLFTGSANAPRSAIADGQELAYILKHSGSTTLVVEDLKTLHKIRQAVDDLGIRRVILLSDETEAGCLNFTELLQKGQEHGFTPPVLEASQLATLIYTSGTTGQPKGVMLTHGNLMHQVSYLDVIVQPEPGNRVLSILPTWHSYERACEYFLLSRACTLVYTNPRQLKKDFQSEHPHFLIAVPRIWETVYEGIQKQFKDKSAGMQKVIQTLLSQSEQYVLWGRIADGKSLPHLQAPPLTRWLARIRQAVYAPAHFLADKLVFAKVRQVLGHNFKQAISGGGSLPAYLDTFYEMAGITILNGYGLTETSPVLAARRPDNNLRGSVGPAIPHTELQIVHPDSFQPLPQGQKGLIRARGPQVMAGYYQNPEATAKVLDPQGWFNTGDLGWLTPDGQLVITGRAKDTIVLLNGENIEPQPLEDACSQIATLSQIVVVGQDQKRLGALIYPNLDALNLWAAQNGIPERDDALLPLTAVRKFLLSEMQQRIRQRPGYRSDDEISDFRFVPEPFSVENGLMTQTLKIRRLPVAERYSALIDEMFKA